MALEEFIYRSNTASISSISTRGQPLEDNLLPLHLHFVKKI